MNLILVSEANISEQKIKHSLLSLINIKFCHIMSISKGMTVLVPTAVDTVVIMLCGAPPPPPPPPPLLYFFSFLLSPSTLSPAAAFSSAFNGAFEV